MPRIRMTDRSVKALRPRAGDQVDYFDDRLPRFGTRQREGAQVRTSPGSSSTAAPGGSAA